MTRAPVPRWVLVAAALVLFLVWSNTFLAFEVLLAPRAGHAPLDWWGLLVARMLPAGVVCAAWCFGARTRESIAIVRRHPVRLLVCGALVVLAYNGFMYHGMQHHVGGPVASVVTTLTPLYLVVLGTVFLRERLTARRVAGLALGLAGLVLLATSKGGAGGPEGTSGLRVLEVAMAPLAWSIYSALTKPVAREQSPILWTFLVVAAGSVLLVPLLALVGAPDVTRLDGRGLALVAYLSFAATIGGNAVWSWLLRHLPAGTVGLTVFLNPPLTLVSKFVLAAALPAAFAVTITTGEWLGGLVMLAGVALAVVGPRPAAATPAAAGTAVAPPPE